MRSLPITLLALAVSVAAQIPGLPECAGSCLGSSYGGCSSYDAKCICSNASFLSGLSCCVSQKCSEAEQKQTIQFADAFCQGFGVTDLPQTATCTGNQAATVSSGTGTDVATVPASLTSAVGAAGSAVTSSAGSAPTSSAGSGASRAEGAGLGLAMAGLLALL